MVSEYEYFNIKRLKTAMFSAPAQNSDKLKDTSFNLFSLFLLY